MVYHHRQPPRICCESDSECYVCAQTHVPVLTLKTNLPPIPIFSLCRHCVKSLTAALAYLDADPFGEDDGCG